MQTKRLLLPLFFCAAAAFIVAILVAQRRSLPSPDAPRIDASTTTTPQSADRVGLRSKIQVLATHLSPGAAVPTQPRAFAQFPSSGIDEELFLRFRDRLSATIAADLRAHRISADKADCVVTLLTLDNLAALFAAPILTGADRLSSPEEIASFRSEIRALIEELIGFELLQRLTAAQQDASLAEAAATALDEIEKTGPRLDGTTQVRLVELMATVDSSGSIGNLIAAEHVTMADVQAIRAERAQMWEAWASKLPPHHRGELPAIKRWYDAKTDQDVARTIDILTKLKSLRPN